jgi:hypothetical protein
LESSIAPDPTMDARPTGRCIGLPSENSYSCIPDAVDLQKR